MSQELLLPASLNGVVGENVTFDPISVPPPPYTLVSWIFNGLNIVTVAGDALIIPDQYKDKVSLDRSTLALKLRNLTLTDSGVYALSVQTGNAVTAQTSLHVFGEYTETVL